jgi:hypothetical protein
MRIRAVLLAGVIASATALAPATAQASPAASVRPASVSARRCAGGQLLAWVGLSGRPGTARGVTVPLEFSNVSRRACWLSAYPGVVALGPSGHQAAPPAGRKGGPHPHRVTLRPGQTAHAALTIGIAKASCRAPVIADAVRITPPGTRAGQQVGLVFRVCARHRTLAVGPVRAGTGIP